MRRAAALATVVLAPMLALYGWGCKGPRIVADIAQERLTEVTKRNIQSLIGNNTLASVANGADEVRPERDETYDWHFVDIPRNAQGFSDGRDCYRPEDRHKGAQSDHQNCVVDRIEYFKRVLGDKNAPRDERIEASNSSSTSWANESFTLATAAWVNYGSSVDEQYYRQQIIKVVDQRLATGQRASMTDASGTTTYTYDNRDRLKTKATPEGTLSYAYDAHGNVVTVASSNANGASMTYAYDGLNRLASVTDNRMAAQGGPSTPTAYSYDAAGNLTRYAYPNTVQTGNVFDPLNRLTQTCAATSSPPCSAGTKLASYAYTLGAAGNRLSVAELSGRTVNYGYDNDYRLTSEAIANDSGGNNGTVGNSYDAVGNRIQMTSTLNAVPPGSFSYDANDRLTTDVWDANGNTVSSGGISYSYDFEDRLLMRGAVLILYDGDGNRVSETAGGVTTEYLVDALNPTGLPQVVDEVVNGSVTRTYAYGLERVSEDQLVNSTWTPSFYGYDGHGNVRFLSNSAGTVTDTYQFDAFGMQIVHTGTTPNSFLYSGEQFDSSTSMYQLRARWYRPEVGRFITRDPVEGVRCSPLSFNPYIYVWDNPVNRIDPTGRTIVIDRGLLGSVLILATYATVMATGKQAACIFLLTGSALYELLQNIPDVESIRLNFSTCSAEVQTRKDDDYCKKKKQECIEQCEPFLGIGGSGRAAISSETR